MKLGSTVIGLALAATLSVVVVAGPSGAGPGADADGDGVQDNLDNCLLKPNASQTDTNQDGIGNACDGNFADNHGLVGAGDFAVLLSVWAKSEGEVGYLPQVDTNDDGVIGAPDFALMLSQWGGPPGPSGRACAGTTPCPDPALPF